MIITPNPLKQGLKLSNQLKKMTKEENYYPKSTKTRIETNHIQYREDEEGNYYPKSTKTRIET